MKKKKTVYLDYAAATPVNPGVLKAMLPFFSDNFYNPSALYVGARGAKDALDGARANVARSLGCRPSEVIFTAGGTESANLAVSGIMDGNLDGEIIISAIEHDAVRKPAGKYKVKECPVDQKGRLKIDELERLITAKTSLVSVMYANNEVGTLQPIKKVVELVHEERKKRLKKGNKRPILIHTDACQAPQYLDVNVARLGVDLMTLNGGKMYGPKQSGVLYCRAGVILSPQILGGGQEFGLRNGTENVAFAVGFAKSLELAIKRKKGTLKRTIELSKYFSSELETRFSAVINGHKKHRLPNNVHATFPGVDNERVLFSLDEQGVWAASGSACSASKEESSHVLTAMDISEQNSRSSLRFSLGRETTREEIDYVLGALDKALKA